MSVHFDGNDSTETRLENPSAESGLAPGAHIAEPQLESILEQNDPIGNLEAKWMKPQDEKVAILSKDGSRKLEIVLQPSSVSLIVAHRHKKWRDSCVHSISCASLMTNI